MERMLNSMEKKFLSVLIWVKYFTLVISFNPQSHQQVKYSDAYIMKVRKWRSREQFAQVEIIIKPLPSFPSTLLPYGLFITINSL